MECDLDRRVTWDNYTACIEGAIIQRPPVVEQKSRGNPRLFAIGDIVKLKEIAQCPDNGSEPDTAVNDALDAGQRASFSEEGVAFQCQDYQQT